MTYSLESPYKNHEWFQMFLHPEQSGASLGP